MILKKCNKEAAQREYEGYKWFGVETKLTDKGILIPHFEGKRFPFYNGITGNEKWITKLIHFYIKVWGEKKFAIHGDLCLCNVIFGDTIHIIDWEHFHYAHPRYFGFDIINMLFIHLQYEYRWRTRLLGNWVAYIKPKHRFFIRQSIEMLGTRNFLKEPFSKSMYYIQRYMDKDKFILSKQRGDVLESLDWICE